MQVIIFYLYIDFKRTKLSDAVDDLQFQTSLRKAQDYKCLINFDPNNNMQIGLAAGIFVIIAIFVMILFCIITRYFQYRINRQMRMMPEIVTINQQLNKSVQDLEGEYDYFIKKRKLQGKKNKAVLGTNKQQEKLMLEMTEIRTPMVKQFDQIYKKSIKKVNLKELQITDNPINSVHNHDLNSVKHFQPSPVNNLKLERLKKQEQSLKKTMRTPAKAQFQKYKYISRLTNYNQKGIFIIENDLKSIIKTEDNSIIQNKLTKTSLIKLTDSIFEDQLYANGFQRNSYAIHKYTAVILLPNIKKNQQYLTKSLIIEQQTKQPLSISDYQTLKNRLLNEH